MSGELGSDTPFKYIDLSAVSRGVVNWDDLETYQTSTAPSRAQRRVRLGDCLFGTVRPTQQSHGFVDRGQETLIASTGFSVLRAKAGVAEPRFIYHWMLSGEALVQAERVAVGSNYPAVNESDVASFVVKLPSVPEQRRIADILDALDAQIECQRRVVKKLVAVAQGVSEEQLSLIVQNVKSARLDEVADIGSGVTLGGDVESGIELPYLRVANVQDGYIDTSEMKTVRVARSEVARYLLEVGDVLLTEGGDIDKLGRGAVWDGRIDPCICQNHIFRVRCRRETIRPEFMAAYAGSIEGKAYFLGIAKQTTNLATINSTQLKAMPIPLPSVVEQDRFIHLMKEARARLDVELAMTEKLLTLKQGLAEDLLTGRARVPEAEAVVESL
ncbi:restriction endonuclease subunit S [Actinomadura bangladeshensis]|uniref:restriction endonuclease subunit S n=1 Tax=Actinomadura bangladeshensis TaxID=453573 RepID=UPI0014044AA5|nr:restriction endonuclease subunit S [Actinomadura bangladeshensis]